MAKTKKSSKRAVKRDAGPSRRVILYHLDQDVPRGQTVRDVLASAGIPVRTATDADLTQTVGFLAGLTGFKRSSKEFEGISPDTEFMLFSNVPNATVDEILAALRKADCVIDHKAMVTQYNRLWPFHHLIEQIVAEHAAMNGM